MAGEGGELGPTVGTNIVLTEIVKSLERGDLEKANKQFGMAKDIAEGSSLSSGKMVLTRLQGLGLIEDFFQEKLDVPDEKRLGEIVKKVKKLPIRRKR